MKKPIKYVKKQPTDWENIIANGISDNELIFKVHKQLIPLKIKQATWLKCEQRTPVHIFLRRYTEYNRQMKRCSISLIIKEMEIKITKRCHLRPFKMAIIGKTTNNKSYQEYREKGTLCTFHESVNLCSHCGKQDGASSKN